MSVQRAAFVPVRVFVGPVEGWTGPIAHARTMIAPSLNVAAAATASAQAASQMQASASGPTEPAAPAPLALLGATSPLPATLATTAFVRKTKTLSLAVPSAKRRLHASAPAAKVASTEPASAKPETKAKAPLKAKAKVVAKHPVKTKTSSK